MLPGRTAIGIIAGVAFCFGGACLVGCATIWRNQGGLSDLRGAAYLYYLLRPLLYTIGSWGLTWRCVVYADAIAHNPFNSVAVRNAHGRVWNWIAGSLLVFLTLAACQILMF